MKYWKKIFIVVLVSMLLLAQIPVSAAVDYLTDGGRRIPISKTYDYGATYASMGRAGFLNAPQDIYIDNEDHIYIADTGNNRIVVLNSDGSLWYTVEPKDNSYTLNEPSGITADKNGHLFIGDTGNKRILNVSPDGKLLKEYGTPSSNVLDENFIFTPRRVAVTDTGYLYTIKEKSLMKIDEQNSFKGYIGATKLGFSIETMLIRMFASKKQKESLLTKEPPPYLSFALAKDGMLYATTTDEAMGQIMKFDMTGSNMFPNIFYGEYSTDEEGNKTSPYFADITADKNSIVTAIDQRLGKLYQYDKNGNLICVFGNGIGNMKGQFSVPCAVDIDSKGNVYVLDSQLGTITVYYPTSFIRDIHTAIAVYGTGNYNESERMFQQVLDIDAGYEMAYEGIGRIQVKNQDYVKAMESYKLANDKSGYSTAFSKYRHELFREYFFIVLLCCVAILIGAVFIYKGLKKASAKIMFCYQKDRVKNNILFYFLPLGICMLFDPVETTYLVKRHRARKNWFSVAVVFVLVALTRVGTVFLTHYPLATADPKNTNLILECGILLIPFLTWAIAQYAVTAIFSGEAKFGEILTLCSLSMVPYILLSIPIALISNILCLNETALYSVMTGIMWIWIAILMLRCLKNSNDYTFGKMILVTLITICTVLLIWIIIILLVAFGGQFIDFIKNVFTELGYAMKRGA